MFKVAYSVSYFIQGALIGLFLSYYAFLMSVREFSIVVTLFLLAWTVKPLYSFIIDKFNYLASIFSIFLAFILLTIPSGYLSIEHALLIGIAMGLLDVSADGWLTTLTREKRVDPNFWSGLGFAIRTIGFLLIVALTMIDIEFFEKVLFTWLKVLGFTLALITGLAFTKFRFSEEGDIEIVLRHFTNNILLYISLYFFTSWASAIFDVATKLKESRILLLEIIFLTTIFSILAHRYGINWYIFKFTIITSALTFFIALYSTVMNYMFGLELTIAIMASLPWPIYGILNDKASEVNSYTVFYTSLLYGISNLTDAIYINTILFVLPTCSYPIVYLILGAPFMVIYNRYGTNTV